mgnify:CR=1 FL=1
MITDDMMAQAAAELADAINESLPNPSECTHQFSPRFEKKMKRLIRKSHHPIFYRTLRTVASIVLVILIGFGSTLAVSAEAREIVFSWVKQQYENFYEYFFEGDVTPTESRRYQTGWMPDGCEFVTSYETAGGEVYIFTDEKDTLIQFSYTSNPDNETLFIDGVGYFKEEAIINGRIGDFYIAQSNDKTNGLIWTDETETVLFFVSGNYDKETLVKIAESVEKNN